MASLALRWLFVALLLPALAAPQGIAWVVCLCTGAEECCEVAPDGCCPSDRGESDREGCADDCADCSEVEVDGVEPLVLPAELDLALVLDAWGLEPAGRVAPPRPSVGAPRDRAPPRVRARVGPATGVQPLRI